MGWKETEALSDETDGEDGESPIARGEMEKASDGEWEVGRRWEAEGERESCFLLANSVGQLEGDKRKEGEMRSMQRSARLQEVLMHYASVTVTQL